jgi:hypothetical protein
MPATIPQHIVIRSRLAESVTHALELSERLESLIAVKARHPSGSFHGKVDHSQPPWNASVAYAVTDLHALARKMEKEIRAELGLSPRARGSSDGNTGEALRTVVRQCERADDFTVRVYTRELEKWWRNAKIALDEIEIPKRLPRSPGKPEPACPWCKNHTLRVKTGENDIFCVNPSCSGVDEKDRKLHARMDYSDVAGDWVVRWDDGVIMAVAA